MAKITALPVLEDIDGSELLPAVKNGVTGRATLGALAQPTLDAAALLRDQAADLVLPQNIFIDVDVAVAEAGLAAGTCFKIVDSTEGIATVYRREAEGSTELYSEVTTAGLDMPGAAAKIRSADGQTVQDHLNRLAPLYLKIESQRRVVLEEFGGIPNDESPEACAANDLALQQATATRRPVDLVDEFYAFRKAWAAPGAVIYSDCGSELRPGGPIDTSEPVDLGDPVEVSAKRTVIYALGALTVEGVTLADPNGYRDLDDPHDWLQPLHEVDEDYVLIPNPDPPPNYIPNPDYEPAPLPENYFFHGIGVTHVDFRKVLVRDMQMTAGHFVNARTVRLIGNRSENCRGTMTGSEAPVPGLPILSDERSRDWAFMAHPQYPKGWDGPHVWDVLCEGNVGIGIRGDVAVFAASIAAGTNQLVVEQIGKGPLRPGMTIGGLMRPEIGVPAILMQESGVPGESGTYRLSHVVPGGVSLRWMEAEDVLGGLWRSREVMIHVHAFGTEDIGYSWWESVTLRGNKADGYRRGGELVGTEDHRNPNQRSRLVQILDSEHRNCGQQPIKFKAGSNAKVIGPTVEGGALLREELQGNHEGLIYMQATENSQLDDYTVHCLPQCLGVVMATGSDANNAVTLADVDPSHPLYFHFYAVTAFSSSQYIGHPGRHQMAGRYIEIIAGTGAGQVRRVATFDRTTRRITTTGLDPSSAFWDVQPDETSLIAVWSIPNAGVKLGGNPAEDFDGEETTPRSHWTNTGGSVSFQLGTGLITGAITGLMSSEPLFLCGGGELNTINCIQACNFRSAGLSDGETGKNTRGMRLKITHRWSGLIYANGGSAATHLAAAVNVSGDASRVEFDVEIHGAIGSGLNIQGARHIRGTASIERTGLARKPDGETQFTDITDIRLQNADDVYLHQTFALGDGHAITFAGNVTNFVWEGGRAKGTIRQVDADDPPNDAQFICVRGIGAQRGTEVLPADDDATLTPGVTRSILRIKDELDGPHGLTLNTTRAIDGDVYYITRDAGTGDDPYTVGDLGTLAAGERMIFAFSAPTGAPLDAGEYILLSKEAA